MARLLNATGYFSSILAAVCLCLAVLAAPIGEARAAVPEQVEPPYNIFDCLAKCGCNGSPPFCSGTCPGVRCVTDCRCYLAAVDNCQCKP